MKTEYRVRKVTRYIVTKYTASEHTGGVETKGEYDNEDVAYEVAYALCRSEHEASGQPIDSENFVYPQRFSEGNATPCFVHTEEIGAVSLGR